MPYKIDETRFLTIQNMPFRKAPVMDFTGMTYALDPNKLNIAIDDLIKCLNEEKKTNLDSTDILYVQCEPDHSNLLHGMISHNQFSQAMAVICRAAGFDQDTTLTLLKQLPSRKIGSNQSLTDIYTSYMPFVDDFEKMMETVDTETTDKLHTMINAVNDHGKRPIDIAALGNNPSLFRLLIAGGAVIDQQVESALARNRHAPESVTQKAMRAYAGISAESDLKMNPSQEKNEARSHSNSNASDLPTDTTDLEISTDSDSEPDGPMPGNSKR